MLKKCFHINLPDLEDLLSGLIKSGFIYKHESGNEIIYSVKTTSGVNKKYKFETDHFEKISNTKKKQTKVPKTLAKEDINNIETDDHEVMQILNMKSLPDIPEKANINGTENDVELHGRELSDDINT